MGESCSCLRSEENPQKEIRTSEDGGIITIKEKSSVTQKENEAPGTFVTHEEPATQSFNGVVVKLDASHQETPEVSEAVQDTERKGTDDSEQISLDFVSQKVVRQHLNCPTINHLRETLGELELEPLKGHKKLQELEAVRIDDGLLYIGEWNKAFQPHGRGMLILENSFCFEGYMIAGEKSGYGRIIFSSGDVYEGEFKGDQIHGNGVLTTSDNSRIEGLFSNGEIIEGTQIAVDGTKYRGKFKNGSWHGMGKLKRVNGDVYSGEFRKGKFHGTGLLAQGNGNSYDGHWVNDKREGQGVFTWKDGRKYQGDYVNNERDGTGTYWDADGSVYTGEWAHGKKHGQGQIEVVIHGKRRVKSGEWRDGVRI